jgi:exopolysaccharide production protein ExoZ
MTIIPSKSATNAPPTIVGLQYLRGFSAVAVMVIHCSSMMSHPEYFGARPLDSQGLGGVRVAIFFVLSAFINVYVTIDASGRPKMARNDFAIRRAIRLLPIMWIAILVYNLASSLGTKTTDWPAIIGSLALWPWSELRPNVLWSMRHEVVFLVVFYLAMLGKKPRWGWVALWAASPILVGAATQLFAPQYALIPAPLRQLIFVVFLEHSANLLFGVGIFLAILFKRKALLKPWLPGGALTVFLLAFLGMASVGWLLPLLINEAIRGLVFSVLSAAIVVAAVGARPWLKIFDQLGRILGDASYAIFLFHPLVVTALLEISMRVFHGPPGPLLFVLVLFSGIGIGFGIAVHYLVEAPLVRFLMKRMRPKAPTPVGLEPAKTAP